MNQQKPPFPPQPPFGSPQPLAQNVSGQGQWQAQQPQGYGPPPQAQGYGAPPAGGYGAPPPVSPFQPAANPYAPPQTHASGIEAGSRYGDAAGEPRWMQRGRYNAWVYVVFAFIFQIALLTTIIALPGALISNLVTDSDDTANTLMLCALGLGIALGTTGAYFTFKDRWRCIEAFSSRWCAGIMNLSLMYVPIVALVYANVRGVQKMFGK